MSVFVVGHGPQFRVFPRLHRPPAPPPTAHAPPTTGATADRPWCDHSCPSDDLRQPLDGAARYRRARCLPLLPTPPTARSPAGPPPHTDPTPLPAWSWRQCSPAWPRVSSASRWRISSKPSSGSSTASPTAQRRGSRRRGRRPAPRGPTRTRHTGHARDASCLHARRRARAGAHLHADLAHTDHPCIGYAPANFTPANQPCSTGLPAHRPPAPLRRRRRPGPHRGRRQLRGP